MISPADPIMDRPVFLHRGTAGWRIDACDFFGIIKLKSKKVKVNHIEVLAWR